MTHGEESNRRLEDNLSEQGIECVRLETEGRVYGLGEASVEVDAGLVYPSRLMEGGVMDALSGFPWIVGVGDVLTSRNKMRCLALLDKEGVPVPDTCLVSNPWEGELDVEFPVVVKPNSATRGNGVVRVEDGDSLRGVMDYFDALHESSLVFDRSYLVQEYLEDARDYRVMVIDGEYVGAVERRGEGWKHNVHRGAEAVGVTPRDEVVGLALRAAGVLGLDFCGVDVLDGVRTVVNEVNVRPTIDSSSKYEPEFYRVLARLVESAI